jgi:hypothetical protein
VYHGPQWVVRLRYIEKGRAGLGSRVFKSEGRVQYGSTVQRHMTDCSQAQLVGDVIRHDSTTPLTVHNVARAMGRSTPRAAHAIIYLLQAIEP